MGRYVVGEADGKARVVIQQVEVRVVTVHGYCESAVVLAAELEVRGDRRLAQTARLSRDV